MTEYYFYSGNTPTRHGNNQQFCGIWSGDYKDKDKMILVNDICNHEKNRIGSDVVLVALNEI